MKVNCAECGLPLDAPEMPQPQIHNTPISSVLVLEHPKQAYCLQCKTAVAIMLTGANLQLMAVPLAKRAQDPLIVVPGLPKNGRG